MVNKQDTSYRSLVLYAEELHAKNKKRIKASGIALIVLPIVLGLVRWLTDSDKTVFLIIWVIFMFLISILLVGIEYSDHTLYRRIKQMTGTDAEYDTLVDGQDVVSDKVKEKIRDRLDSVAPADAEEGGDE